MDWLANIPLIGSPAVTLFAFVTLIGIVVAIHEFGHYIVARWVGIHAEVFSLGFGPKLWSRVDKRGTTWQLAAIPLGGYVKFLGDKDAASTGASDELETMNAYDRRRSFPAAAVWRRFLTVLAGPVFNFILSILLFAGIAMWIGQPADRPIIGEVTPLPYENGMQSGDIVTSVNGTPVESYTDLYEVLAKVSSAEDYSDIALTVERNGAEQRITAPFPATPYITNVMPFTPAYNAGIEVKDVIVAVDGQQIRSFYELKSSVTASENQAVEIEVWRDGTFLTLSMTPEFMDRPNAEGGFSKELLIGVNLGFYFEPARNKTPSLLAALEFGTTQVWNVIYGSYSGIKHMVLGNVSVKNLQGPIGIARMSGIVMEASWTDFIGLIAMISTGIGFLNLLPIPVLDGGHLVTYVYEALRGKPPNPKFMQPAMMIGMVLLLSMMLLASYNDIMRL